MNLCNSYTSPLTTYYVFTYLVKLAFIWFTQFSTGTHPTLICRMTREVC
jgi:hypothetical protein